MIPRSSSPGAPPDWLPRLPPQPSVEQLRDVAGHLTARWKNASSIAEALEADGWRMTVRPFSPGSTLQAVATPIAEGRVAIAINEDYEPTARTLNWLLCHEVGHVAVRGYGARAWTRHRPQRDLLEEERLCNRLADAVVGRTALSGVYQNAS